MRLAVFLIFFISTFSIAQIQNDSIDIYSQNFESSFNEMKYDLALISADKLYTFAKQKNESTAQDKAKIYKAKVYYKLKMFDQSISLIEEIIKKNYATKEEITNFLEANNILANIHYSKYEDDKAVAKYFYIDSISEANKFINDVQIRALQNIGLVMLRGYNSSNNKKYGKAKDYFKKAYELAKTSNSSTEIHVSGLYYGTTFVETENPDIATALKFYDEANKYFFENKIVKEFSDTYWAYASLYRKINRNDLATKYYKEFIEKSKTFNDNNALIRAYWAYASFLYEIKNYEEAIENYNAVIEILKKGKNIDYGIISNSYYYLSTIYKSKNDTNLAYEALENYVIYQDSLDQKNNKQQFNEIEIKYQSEKKEQEIELLKAKNEVAEKQKYIYIAIAGLLLVSGLFLFFGYRNKIKTAEKLRELDKTKSRFFANISHEFRTPLTLIKSPVQHLQGELSESRQASKLKLIEHNADRMLDLVDQLLELSKLDSGQLKLVFHQTHISSFLKNIVEPFEYQAKDKNIKFSAVYPKEDFWGWTDKDMLHKLIGNLLSNALKYTPTNHDIRFVAECDDKNLNIEISNSGVELSKAEATKIFERFYQKNDEEGGVGIGLAFVKELVNHIKGDISSDVVDKTLTITLKLPVDSDTLQKIGVLSKAVSSKDHIATDLSDNHIITHEDDQILMLVDDNESVREVLKELFKDSFKIIEADNGQDAFEIAKEHIPDLIISDVMMPKMNGYQLTKKIKTHTLTSTIPIILLTAKSGDDARLSGIESEADAYLTKPFNHKILIAKVNQILKERRKLQEHYSQELILKPTGLTINSIDEEFIKHLEQVLEENMSKDSFSTKDFALKMGMSRMQLHRKLKTLFGVSATEFIRNERLKAAAELLKQKDLSISEIAYHVGFSDVGYFSKCFKKLYYSIPSEYQKNQK